MHLHRDLARRVALAAPPPPEGVVGALHRGMHRIRVRQPHRLGWLARAVHLRASAGGGQISTEAHVVSAAVVARRRTKLAAASPVSSLVTLSRDWATPQAAAPAPPPASAAETASVPRSRSPSFPIAAPGPGRRRVIVTTLRSQSRSSSASLRDFGLGLPSGVDHGRFHRPQPWPRGQLEGVVHLHRDLARRAALATPTLSGDNVGALHRGACRVRSRQPHRRGWLARAGKLHMPAGGGPSRVVASITSRAVPSGPLVSAITITAAVHGPPLASAHGWRGLSWAASAAESSAAASPLAVVVPDLARRREDAAHHEEGQVASVHRAALVPSRPSRTRGPRARSHSRLRRQAPKAAAGLAVVAAAVTVSRHRAAKAPGPPVVSGARSPPPRSGSPSSSDPPRLDQNMPPPTVVAPVHAGLAAPPPLVAARRSIAAASAGGLTTVRVHASGVGRHSRSAAQEDPDQDEEGRRRVPVGLAAVAEVVVDVPVEVGVAGLWVGHVALAARGGAPRAVAHIDAVPLAGRRPTKAAHTNTSADPSRIIAARRCPRRAAAVAQRGAAAGC